MWFVFVAIAALTVAMLFLMPTPKFENARASSLDDLRFPQAKEGMPGALALGTVRVRGPNTIWYGDFEAVPIKKKVKTGLFSSKKVIVGHEYYLGFDMALALGPATKIRKLWWDKDVIWEGSVTASGTAININLPNLFGGKEKGGGFWGTLRCYMGTFAQSVNTYLEGAIGDPLGVPAYNGWVRIVFEKVCIGESPQLRALSVELQNLTNGAGLANPYIGDDLNPAELLYQLLTLQWGGMDVSASELDLDSFIAAGATLYTEGNGMSLLITSATQGKQVIGEVLRQIDGTLYQDPETGKLVLKLIRDDYDIESLPVLDESNIMAVRSFSSTLWENTINQLRVSYTNRENNYEQGMAMAKDMANINAQGRLKSSVASYPGVTNAELANVLAHRDLAQLCVPLFKVTLELNRMPADLRPGDAFLWAWDEYQIDQVVMRVQKFNMGELLNGKLVVEALQDQFAIGNTVISSPGGSGWTPVPSLPASSASDRLVREGHYFFYQAAEVQGDLIANRSGILVAAPQPSGATSAEVNASTDAGATYSVVEEAYVFTPVGTLQTTISATASLGTGVIATVDVSGFTADDLETFTVAERNAGGGLFIIGTEYFLYETVTDLGGGTFRLGNVWRALLDSAPVAHSIGAKVYILSGDNFVDDTFPGDAALRVKMRTQTINETMDLDDVPYDSLTLKNRVWRPACPANIKFDGGTAFTGPANASGSHTITWANRDRTSATVRKITDSTSEYEAGQRTVFRYRKNAGAWTTVTLDPGVTSCTFDAGAVGSDTVDYELYSTRDGVDSYNKWTFSAVAGGSSGSSGGGSAPDTGGSAPPDDQSPYVPPLDGLSIVFPFGETIGTYPIDIPITFDIDIADNFAGSNADVRTNPADGTKTFTMKVNGSSVGTVAITTGGAVTFNTTGAGLSLVAGDTLTCEPPSPEDSAMAGVTISIAGTRPAP